VVRIIKWRLKTARLCLSTQPAKILDLCCGTGDLAITLAQLAPASAQVVGLDYSPPMLEKATVKASRASSRQTGFHSRRCRGFAFPDEYF